MEAKEVGPRVTVPDHVVHRAFEAETVLLNLETGRYHGLNPSGGRLFEVLRETGSMKRAAETVAVEYGATVDLVCQDVTQLVADLEERGLVVVDRG